MLPHVSAETITESNLIRKVVFAFFSHNPEYVENKQNQIDNVQFYLPRLKAIVRKIFRAIENDEYDLERHEWIKPQNKSIAFPSSSYGLVKQLEKLQPAFSNTNASKFCHSFSAVCVVASDVLYHKIESTDPSHSSIRSDILGDIVAQISEEQMTVLLQVVKTLQKQIIYKNPDWAVTYDNRRPIIKTDKTSHFSSSRKAKAVLNSISGRYLIYRHIPNGSKTAYVQEYLLIKASPIGGTFEWQALNLEDGSTIHTNGVIYCTKGIFYLQGHDQVPYQRVCMAMGSSVFWAEPKREDTILRLEHSTVVRIGDELLPYSASVFCLPELAGGVSEKDFKDRCREISETEIKGKIGRNNSETLKRTLFGGNSFFN